MLQRQSITDFSYGELSELMAGRFDLDLYKKGCSKLENWLVIRQGGVTTKPGQKYIGETKGGAAARLIPFVVSDADIFVLELGPYYMRIWRNDALLLNGGVPRELVTPYASMAHINEIQVAQDGASLYLAHKSYAPQMLTRTDDATWSFGTVPITGNTGKLPFQGVGNYPGVVAIWGGRIWWASSYNEPQKIWASETFEYDGYLYYETTAYTVVQLKDPSTWANPDVPEYENVTTTRDEMGDASAMEILLGSDKLETPRWMAGGRALVIGCATSEFIVPAGVTANAPQAVQQTRMGSAPIQGRMVNDAIVFVQRDGRRLLEYYYLNDEGAYKSPDLTYFADHILGTGVAQWDFMQTPQSMLMFVRKDGVLAALVYDKLYGVSAWSRLITAAGGLYESVAVVPDATGRDVAYFLVNRGGVRCLEKMDQIRGSGYSLDCYSVHQKSATISGLDRFADGSVVSVVYGDEVYTATVNGGQITAPAEIPDGEDIGVGWAYTCTLRLLRPVVQTQEGPSVGKPCRVNKVTILFDSSYPVKVGYSETDDYLETSRFDSVPFSGPVPVDVDGEWEGNGWVAVVQDQPLPATILAMLPEVDG